MPSTSSSGGAGQHSSAATSLNRSIPKITLRRASSSSTASVKKGSAESSSSVNEMELLDVADLRNLAEDPAVALPADPMAAVKADSPRLYLLYGIIILQLTICITEIIVDWMTHSVLILTDCYHHLFNACNAILLVLSFRISNQSTVKNTFGFVRLEVLGMLTTTTFIVALIFSLLIEGLLQLSHLHEIHLPTDPSVLLIFGGWSLVVNLFYVLTINGVVTEKKYKETTRTERAFSTANCQPSGRMRASTRLAPTDSTVEVVSSTTSYGCEKTAIFTVSTSNDSNNNNGNNRLQVDEKRVMAPVPPTTDTTNCFFGSLLKGIFSPLIILITSAVMFLLDDRLVELQKSIDPGMGVATAIVLCLSFYPQLKEHFLILMQTVPQNVDVESLKKEMLEKFPILENVHELHIWRLTSTKIVATCHIVLPRLSTADYVQLFNAIRSHLSSPQYGIAYVTIQPEFSNWSQSRNGSDQEVTSTVATPRVTENQCFMKCKVPKVDGCSDEEAVPPCESLTCCAAGNADLNRVAIHGHGHSHGHSHDAAGHGHSH